MVLKSRTLAPDWSAGNNPEKAAKCFLMPLPSNHEVNAETDPFFYDENEARHVCNGTYDNYVCPFREVCLYRALVNNEQAGTFGGMTVEQRRWIRRNKDLIDKDTWDQSDGWRWIVPEPEYFEETEAADGNQESAEEFAAEADSHDAGSDRVEEVPEPAGR